MIETQDLSKHYGSLKAVDRLTFTVQPGEVLGFLGPNGAGKSTTMKMLAGFLTPTAGTARVCGFDAEKQALQAKSCIGYLPEGAPCYGEMTPRRFLDFIADLRGLRGAVKTRRLAEVVERLQLAAVFDQPIETLSKGFKRRVGLAQAILHDPQVLILDEPTDGLDPNQKHEVRGLISSMAKDKIIVISTHILEEVHAVCNRAIIIAHGRILADDTPHNLEIRSRYHNAVTLELAQPEMARAALTALPGVAAVEIDPASGQLTAFPQPGQTIFPAISELARREQWALRDLRVETGRLDEVFRTITLQEAA